MRLARIIIVVSTIAAALLEAYLATSFHPRSFWIAIAGFAGLLVAGERLRPVSLPLLLAASYVTPAAYILFSGGSSFALDAIWVLPLLGLTLSGRGGWHWSLPGRWQWPLMTWALIVAVSWPIVFLREADFAPWILPLDRVSNSSVGGSPWDVGLNVTYFVLGHNVGILFVDAMCRWYDGSRAAFRREVLAPLLAAVSISAAVAIYQGFVDLTFLNHGFWAYMIRAAGTAGDPNLLGAIAGFWTIGGVAYARGLRGPWSIVVSIAAVSLGAAAAWLSGSRTGLVAVLVSVAIATIETLRWSRLDVRRLAIGAAGALVIGAALVLALQRASTHTIVQRGTLGYLPLIGDRGIVRSADELLWDRFGYGPTAIQMIKEHPIEGVGPGLYPPLSHDFGKAIGRVIPKPDNAQAWWRHNLAELGIVGFIPLLWWCIVCGRELFARRAAADRLSSGMLRGVLVAFFIASLFGLPSQNLAVTITFWIFVFWFTAERGVAAATEETARPDRRLLVGAVVLCVAHLAMTTVNAFGDLRPRERSMRFDWFYKYGMTELEPEPAGGTVGRRFTTETKSLAVVKVQGRTLKLAAWIDHPDGEQNPVHVRIWADGNLVYEGAVKRSTPVFLNIPPTPGRTHVIIETEIDRLFRPSDYGSRDRRTLGLSLRDWVWE